MSLVGSFGGSFFTWFQYEVLPYLMGSLYIIVSLLGIIFNSVLITTIRKRKLLEIRTNVFVLQLAIMDLISCILFILPSAVTAFIDKWLFTNYACKVHGVIFTMCYLGNFLLLSVMGIERSFRAKRFDIHDRVFLRSTVISKMTTLIWILSTFVASAAVLPISGWVSIEYDKYQAACLPRFSANIYYLCIVFVLGYCVCFVSYFITYIIIFNARRSKLKITKKLDTKTGENTQNKVKASEVGKSNGKKTEEENLVSDAPKDGANTNEDRPAPKLGWMANEESGRKGSQSKFAALNARNKIKKALTKVQVAKVFSDDKSDPDFHLAITYLILACTMLFLWLPYFIICFVSSSDPDLWGGYSSIMSIIAMLSYCLKPVIYLAHNQNYQEVTKETIPDKVIRKASQVRYSIAGAMDKVDKLVFKSSQGQKKLNVTLKTALIAKNWLRRARKRIKERQVLANGKTNIPMSTLTNINEEEDVSNHESEKSKETSFQNKSDKTDGKVTGHDKKDSSNIDLDSQLQNINEINN